MADQIIDFDVETTGLQPYSKGNEAFLWIFSDGETHEAIPFSPSGNPIDAWGIPGANNLVGLGPGGLTRGQWAEHVNAMSENSRDRNRQRIQDWFDRVIFNVNVLIRAWNAKFDRAFADQADCFVIPGDGKWRDGMVTAHAVDERRSVALKAVASQLFGEEAADPQKRLKEWLNAENRRRSTLLTDAEKAQVGTLRIKYVEATCLGCKGKTGAHADDLIGEDCIHCGEVVGFTFRNRTRLASADERAEVIAAAAKVTDDHGDYIRANYSHVPRDIMEPYALEDVILTRRVSDVYDPRVEAGDLKRVVEFETQVMDALYAIEKRGLPVKDHGIEYRRLEQEVIENLERLEARVKDLAMEADPVVYGKALAGDRWGPDGHWIEVSENGQVTSYQGGVALLENFNPKSSAQVLAAIKARGADMSFMSVEDGKLSADAENLRAVDDDLAGAILDFRAEFKVLSTYVRPMIGRSYVSSMNIYKEPFIAPDSKIHANYRQVGARTGRMSVSDPSVQNQPRDDLRLRYNIVADPGYSLVTCDLSNIEMVLFAAYCGQGRLLTAIQNGDDVHTLTAQMIGLRDRKRPGGGYESARQQGKVFNFTIIYGGGLRSIKRYFRVNQNDARKYKMRFMEAYPEVAKLQNVIDYRLQDQGYIQDRLISGRRFRVDPRESYKAVNYLVQGTAASLLKYAVIKLHGDGIPMVALVHDEIVAHVPTSQAEEVARQIELRMTEFEPLKGVVPLRADAEIVQRWSDAKVLHDDNDREYLFDPEWAAVSRRYLNV